MSLSNSTIIELIFLGTSNELFSGLTKTICGAGIIDPLSSIIISNDAPGIIVTITTFIGWILTILASSVVITSFESLLLTAVCTTFIS